MPVLLEPETKSSRLASSTPSPEALDIFKPYSGELKVYSVSTAINTARSQGKELIEACEPNASETVEADEQPQLHFGYSRTP